MSTASFLSDGPINLNIIRDEARRELLLLLQKCSGSKAVLWDKELMDRFSLIVEYKFLQDNGVEKMHPLKSSPLPKSDVQNIIFICRPIPNLMDVVASVVQNDQERRYNNHQYHIFLVPWKSYLCIQKLEELGVYKNFTNVEEFKLDLVPLDSDILSMEFPTAFYDCKIDSDFTSLHMAARAITKLQNLFGQIPTIHGKGESAQILCDILKRMRSEQNLKSDDLIPTQIDQLLILDRSVDSLSPLVTQLTYEGLIDEIFGIKDTNANFPGEKFTAGDDDDAEPIAEAKKVSLSSKDELFAQLRDKNFNAVGPTLKTTAKIITEQYEERHAARTVGEIKKFVAHIPQMQQSKSLLATHTSIAELIKDFTDTEKFLDTISNEQEFLNGVGTDKVNPYIEESIYRKEELHKVIRLLCMQCICNNGFKPKIMDFYKREILQTYGFDCLLILNCLEKAGLLYVQGGAWNYTTIRKSLRLIVEDINEKDPKDLAYVYSGYAPLSARLVQILSHPGWRSIEEVLRILPGPTVTPIKQTVSRRKWSGSVSSASTTVTLVFFLGGVTYAELSALRFLSATEDGAPKHEYVMATTSIINGNTFIESMIENLKA